MNPRYSRVTATAQMPLTAWTPTTKGCKQQQGLQTTTGAPATEKTTIATEMKQVTAGMPPAKAGTPAKE